MQTELISTKEAARLCGRSEATITRWAADGKIHPVHKGEGLRGAYVFRRQEIESLRENSPISA